MTFSTDKTNVLLHATDRFYITIQTNVQFTNVTYMIHTPYILSKCIKYHFLGFSAIMSVINKCVFEQYMMTFILYMRDALCIPGPGHTFKTYMYHFSQIYSLDYNYINISQKQKKLNQSVKSSHFTNIGSHYLINFTDYLSQTKFFSMFFPFVFF